MIQPAGAGPVAEPYAVTHGLALRLLLCVMLAAATLLVYRESLDHHFVTMDDYTYVVENVQLHEGLTSKTFAWAMQTFLGSSWFPLTWLSLALDMELAGLDPGAYHRTNLLLHSANAVLLYLALVGLTRSHWRSFLTAGVFALHPIHVESVAWVAERKDVLSGFFFMLTLWAWARYAERATALRYLLVPFAAALGLLAKSSLVTLPFVLLLLDFWPLGRLRDSARDAGLSQARLARALLEKVPLFVLAGIAVVATYLAGASSNALETTERLSLLHRMANAAISYLSYLADSFWPVNLTAFYPHPGADVSLGWAAAASLLLLAITIFAISKLRTAPHLLVGWLWFLGTLVPMIGLVQAGPQARADRFMYLPQIGLCIMLIWSIPEAVLSRRVARSMLVTLAAACLFLLAVLSRQQLRIWYDGTTLFEHARSVTRDNAFVRHGLGQAYLRAGRIEDAAREFRAALQLAPRWERPMAAMGQVMSERGEPAKAANWYLRALEQRPDWAEIRAVLAESLVEQGEPKRAIPQLQKLLAAEGYPADNVARAELHALLGLALDHTGDELSAAKHYRTALALHPDYPNVHANLGFQLARQGRGQEALSHLSEAVRLGSNAAEVHSARANLLLAGGREREGMGALRLALSVRPEWLAPTNNLAWYLVAASDEALRDPKEALELAHRAARLCHRKDPNVLETLAAALEANRQIGRAVEVIDEAIPLARRAGDLDLAGRLVERKLRLGDTGLR